MKYISTGKIIITVLLIFSITGCVGNLIKNRLRPPHEIDVSKYSGIIDDTAQTSSAGKNMHYIIFQYENKAAHYMNLAGNFNGWCGTKEYDRFDPSAGIMRDDNKDGIWEIVLPLPSGRYQYKFVIDQGASWVEDPNNPLKDFENGIENSLLIISD
ncbi:hypothetical protein DRQ29_05645 [bacterium]|nr:MAG: hypothetical protein DRQ29_05645 [bacterium]